MTTQWKPIEGSRGYEVSSCGRVRSVDRVVRWGADGKPRYIKGQELQPFGACDERRRVTLSYNDGSTRQSYARICLLVATTFIGAMPRGHYVYHKNGNIRDDRLDNLEYKPLSFIQRGVSLNGRGKNRKLNPEKVHLIRALAATGVSQGVIAAEIGVDRSTCSDVLRGKTWSYI